MFSFHRMDAAPPPINHASTSHNLQRIASDLRTPLALLLPSPSSQSRVC
jgi:hypothetical protein